MAKSEQIAAQEITILRQDVKIAKLEKRVGDLQRIMETQQRYIARLEAKNNLAGQVFK